MYRSHPVILGSRNVNDTGGPLFTNVRSGSVAVVTFAQMINTSSQAGDSIALEVSGVNTAGVLWHSGFAGQGSLDRFPLVCEIPVLYENILGYTAVVGTWDILVVGYYTPQVFTG